MIRLCLHGFRNAFFCVGCRKSENKQSSVSIVKNTHILFTYASHFHFPSCIHYSYFLSIIIFKVFFGSIGSAGLQCERKKKNRVMHCKFEPSINHEEQGETNCCSEFSSFAKESEKLVEEQGRQIVEVNFQFLPKKVKSNILKRFNRVHSRNFLI